MATREERRSEKKRKKKKKRTQKDKKKKKKNAKLERSRSARKIELEKIRPLPTPYSRKDLRSGEISQQAIPAHREFLQRERKEI